MDTNGGPVCMRNNTGKVFPMFIGGGGKVGTGAQKMLAGYNVMSVISTCTHRHFILEHENSCIQNGKSMNVCLDCYGPVHI